MEALLAIDDDLDGLAAHGDGVALLAELFLDDAASRPASGKVFP